MNTQTDTQTAGAKQERNITLYLTREQIDALNIAAARLGMTAPEMLKRALMAEMKNRPAALMA